MDTKGIIQEHSQEKLDIYKNYLESYLSILTNTKWSEQIYIYDFFAGSGKDESGAEGSALVAADIISSINNSNNSNNSTYIKLIVNDIDRDRCNLLRGHLEKYLFVDINNLDAGSFIQKLIQDQRTSKEKRHSLFFFDPFGYTQISLKDLFDLNLKTPRSETLIFIPISAIRRFANSDSKQAVPIRDFLRDLGISTIIKDNNDLIEKITKAFKNKFQSKYVYHYKISNQECGNSEFSLFFTTKHIKGAEKFLEAMDKTKNSSLQLELFRPSNEGILVDYISIERTNKEIYEWGIIHGLLPKYINADLKQLQKEGKLIIDPVDTRRNSFYLKDKRKIIKIKYLALS